MQATARAARKAQASPGAGAAVSSAANLLSSLKYRVTPPSGFVSKVFQTETICLADRKETVVRGGRSLFPLLPKAFEGVRQIGIVGWGSQGPAQAQNLRESLEGSGIRVKVGLRTGSLSCAKAEQKNFSFIDNTLGDLLDVVHESDLNIILISDAAMASEYKEIFGAARPNTYLGLSHGFLLGHLQAIGEDFPANLGVIAVCPKGMGPSVRRLYEQGRSVNGAGINSSFAVYRDIDGRAVDMALGWSIAIGSPVTFQTSLDCEYKSDIFGERGILLGAVHGVCEVLYRYFVSQGTRKDAAYLRVVEGITRPISMTISHEGITSLRNKFGALDRLVFDRAYAAAYRPVLDVLLEIYDDVASGREIQSVIDHAERLHRFPFTKIDETDVWKVGANVRAQGIENENVPLDPTVAGIYVAVMMAQCDLLMAAGHAYSEVANESVIESVDSLNPYMRFKGVAYMVDNCSTTARLGARKWAPRFDYAIDQQVLPRLTSNAVQPEEVQKAIADFENSKVHDILKVCCEMRPSVDIVPELTHLG